MRALIMGLVCLSLGSAAIARDPAFDPRAWKSKVAGEKTQVSVLGSVHLKNLGAFKPDDLLPGNHAIGSLARQMETSDAARPFYPAKAIGYGSHHRGYESCRMKSFAKAFIQSSLIG